MKVLIEGIIYYIGVAIVEELYVRGLLLNLIEKLCHNKRNKEIIAIILSSIIFGLGHIFGVLGQSVFYYNYKNNFNDFYGDLLWNNI